MRRTVSRCALIATLAALSGCGGGPKTGDIQFAVVASDQYQLFDFSPQNTTPSEIVSAVVIVTEIDARVGGAWIPVVTTTQPIDLLALDNKTLNTLGVAKLPTGHIDELRLKLDEIGDYVVRKDGVKKPLEVPADGIVKVDGKLDLDACSAGIVILDFDPKIKIEDEPGRREYELTCKAHIKTEEIKGACAPDGGADGGDPCSGVVCPNGQTCEPQNGLPVCVADPCAGVVCPPGTMCDNGQCVPGQPAPDGGSSGMDGGCHHH